MNGEKKIIAVTRGIHTNLLNSIMSAPNEILMLCAWKDRIIVSCDYTNDHDNEYRKMPCALMSQQWRDHPSDCKSLWCIES